MSFKELNTRLINIVGHDRFARNGTIDVADKYPDTLSNIGRCNSCYRKMAGKSFLSNFLIGATMLGASLGLINEVKAEPSTPIQPLHELVMQTPTVPDTVYSERVTSNVLLNGNAVPEASISYTLLDTVNNTQFLVREALTNTSGQDVIDSLPVLKHYTGLEENEFVANNNLIITNNGGGSNHLMRFKTDAKSVTKEGYIFNTLGKQIAILKLDYNPSTKIYDAVWNGENIPTGIYTFLAKTTNGRISEKILHIGHAPSKIDYNAGLEQLNEDREETTTKSGREITDELATSKYAIAITHESLEDYLDTIHIKENTIHEFFFNTNQIQYEDGNVFGSIFFTQGSGSPINANVEYKQLTNQSAIFNTSAPNGMYNIQVPVIYEQANPGQTKYIITITENGDPFETLIDTLLVSPAANNFTHYVEQIVLPPIDTVYSDMITSTVFLNGAGFDGASISYTLLDSITGYKKLIREALTNANGQDIVDSLQVLPSETGLGASKYIINITNEDLEDLIDTVLVQENTVHNFSFEVFEVQPDTVYSDSITSNILLNGVPFDGANINYTIWDTITGNQQLIRQAVSNANGQDIVDSLQVMPSLVGLGASKYIINISNSNLENLIDTVLVQEDTKHDFIFNVASTQQYADGNVTAWIEYSDLTGAPSNADVEYKRLLNQSEIFATTAPGGVYQITVPVVFEPLNPGQTKYIVTISENGGDEFETLIDTILISPNSNLLQHYVNPIIPPDPTLDIEGIVRNVYTKLPESGVTIRLINRTTGLLVDEQVTDANGFYEFLNQEQGALLETELGKSGEFWLTNKEIDVPTAITDTILVQNRYFYPSTVEVPQVGTNTTFQGDGEEAAEMVGSDFINFEEVLRDTDLMWASGPTSSYWSARTWIQDNFYEGTSPITTANTQRNINNTMQSNYEPYTNFYAGQLGWNVDFGSGNSTAPLFATTTYGVGAILGGEIMTTGGLEEYIKELQGRRLSLGTVNSRTSMMNGNPAMPDNKDRAYVYMILINQKGRFSLDEETYNLTDLTSNAPTMRANEGQGVYGKEAPMFANEYNDVPGTQPHSKMQFNQQKFREQKQHQREEQIKSYLLQQLSK